MDDLGVPLFQETPICAYSFYVSLCVVFVSWYAVSKTDTDICALSLVARMIPVKILPAEEWSKKEFMMVTWVKY